MGITGGNTHLLVLVVFGSTTRAKFVPSPGLEVIHGLIPRGLFTCLRYRTKFWPRVRFGTADEAPTMFRNNKFGLFCRCFSMAGLVGQLIYLDREKDFQL